MFPRRTALASSLFGLLLFAPLQGQETRAPRDGSGLDLTINGTGLAMGHVPRVNGIRINFRDHYLEEVNGLNLTLWSPRDEVGGTVRGLAMGVAAPAADRLQGISLGGAAVVAEKELTGIGLGGLAVVSMGASQGIMAGGLATVSEGPVLATAGLEAPGPSRAYRSVGWRWWGIRASRGSR